LRSPTALTTSRSEFATDRPIPQLGRIHQSQFVCRGLVGPRWTTPQGGGGCTAGGTTAAGGACGGPSRPGRMARRRGFPEAERPRPGCCAGRGASRSTPRALGDFESLFSSDNADWPRVVIDHHLGPAELASVFSRSVLNVHPCPYDAYGMTAVESASAAFRCPTVLDRARGRRGRGPASRRPRPGSADRRGTAGGTVRRRHRSRTRGAIARPGVRAFAGPTPGRRNAVSRSAGAAARRVPTWRT